MAVVWRPSAEEIYLPLTVDTTQITVDSTQITVDMTQYASGYHHLIRIIPQFRATEHIVYLKKDGKEEDLKILIDPHFFIYRGAELFIYFNFDFEEGESYEISIFSAEGKRMYRGKGYATDYTDLQEYSMIKKDSTGGRTVKIMR